MRRLALAAGFSLIASCAAAAEPTPAKDCTAKTAETVAINDVASNVEAFLGKCVAVRGWWRDIGIYASRGEAFQPDALSIITLDYRRLGLYLAPKDLAAAPKTAALAEAVGTVGKCTALGAVGSPQTTGYCHHKPGAYLAVAKIGPAP